MSQKPSGETNKMKRECVPFLSLTITSILNQVFIKYIMSELVGILKVLSGIDAVTILTT